MALCSQDAAAIALCKAMLAISAYHVYGSKAAVPYKAEALRAFSKSLARSSTNSMSEHADAHLAVSLMLCMYSVSIAHYQRASSRLADAGLGL
jgi:hypothetical protein